MNKLIGYITVVAMVLVVSCSYGQVSKEAKSENFRAAKIYVNSSYSANNAITLPTRKINLLNEFSPAISWGKNSGNFHEVSVRDLGLMYASSNKKFSSVVGYNYNFKIFKLKPESKFKFYLGAGISAGYSYLKDYNSAAYEISRTSKEVSIDFNLVPRITYKISERTFVDLNIPYSVYSSSKSWNSINRAVSPPGKNSIQVNNRAFPNQFTVSVGVAIKF